MRSMSLFQRICQKTPSMFKPLLRPFSWRGRTSRKEFWLFQIPILFFCIFWKYFVHMEGMPILIVAGILGAYLLLCQIAVVVRRLHDANFSGWWILTLACLVPIERPLWRWGGVLAFYLVFMLKAGTVGPNRFGESPRGNGLADGEGAVFSKTLDIIRKLVALTSVLYIALGGPVLHCYTAYLAAVRSGTSAAVASFFLPMLSECYWAYEEASAVGIDNAYTLLVLGYIVAAVILLAINPRTMKSSR